MAPGTSLMLGKVVWGKQGFYQKPCLLVQVKPPATSVVTAVTLPELHRWDKSMEGKFCLSVFSIYGPYQIVLNIPSNHI